MDSWILLSTYLNLRSVCVKNQAFHSFYERSRDDRIILKLAKELYYGRGPFKAHSTFSHSILELRSRIFLGAFLTSFRYASASEKASGLHFAGAKYLARTCPAILDFLSRISCPGFSLAL